MRVYFVSISHPLSASVSAAIISSTLVFDDGAVIFTSNGGSALMRRMEGAATMAVLVAGYAANNSTLATTREGSSGVIFTMYFPGRLRRRAEDLTHGNLLTLNSPDGIFHMDVGSQWSISTLVIAVTTAHQP